MSPAVWFCHQAALQLRYVQYTPVRFEVLVAVMIEVEVVWNVILCHWVSGTRQFEGL